MTHGRARQRGIALLTAILVVAIATILIAALLDRGEVALARARNVTRGAQADALALGIEDWALDVLRRDAATGDGRDSRNDMWAQPLPPTEVPGGKMSGVMRDLNGCLNVNNLVDAAGGIDGAESVRFARLLVLLRVDDAVLNAIEDWIDPDLQPLPRGAEDSAYAGMRPPYRAANRPMVHVSELRLVRGVTPAVFDTLAPHVCALPRGARVNINTATPEVLASLTEAIDLATARGIIQRGQAFDSVQQFRDTLLEQGIDSAGIDPSGLAVDSEFFLARARIELDDLTFMPVALLQRSRETRELRVVARGRGGF